MLNPANISSDHIPDNLGVRSTGNLSPGATSFEEIMEFHVAEVWNAEVDGIITLVVTRSFASDHKEGSGLGNLTHDLPSQGLKFCNLLSSNFLKSASNCLCLDIAKQLCRIENVKCLRGG